MATQDTIDIIKEVQQEQVNNDNRLGVILAYAIRIGKDRYSSPQRACDKPDTLYSIQGQIYNTHKSTHPMEQVLNNGQ